MTGVTVVKLGGSVLPGPPAVAPLVRSLGPWLADGGRLVVVVSAFAGATDALLAEARGLARRPEPRAYAALLACGEARAAAVVCLALNAGGIAARLLEAHRLGLATAGRSDDAEPLGVSAGTVLQALATAPVVVVPGFVGCGGDGYTTLLGRGGSDLTALVLAHALGARRCLLVKDVDGWYERAPGAGGPPPRRFLRLSWDDALAQPAPVVQTKAVSWARQRRVAFEVGVLVGPPPTRVGPAPTVLAPEPWTPAVAAPVPAVELGVGP